MPVGIFIGLLGALRGVKWVAVFTDSDHHSHPASACIDAFNNVESEPVAYDLGGTKLVLTNNRGWVGTYDPKDLTKKLSYEETRDRSVVRAKDWTGLLEYMLSK